MFPNTPSSLLSNSRAIAKSFLWLPAQHPQQAQPSQSCLWLPRHLTIFGDLQQNKHGLPWGPCWERPCKEGRTVHKERRYWRWSSTMILSRRVAQLLQQDLSCFTAPTEVLPGPFTATQEPQTEISPQHCCAQGLWLFLQPKPEQQLAWKCLEMKTCHHSVVSVQFQACSSRSITADSVQNRAPKAAAPLSTWCFVLVCSADHRARADSAADT